IKSVSLPALIEKIAAIHGRLRLSSIDPWAVTDDFLAAVENSRLCDHFHLSLQSGCDKTLARMNRRYTTDDYAAASAALKKIRPTAAVTTDIIVGFPGETDADFEKSLNFVREMAFAQIHVFEYSAREGTPAASFPDQVPVKIKHERGKIMRESAAELQKNFLHSQVGTTASVLLGKSSAPGMFKGLSTNYCTVLVQSDDDLTRTIKNVEITACRDDFLTGTLK
ncbi:MAG: radical SAM protein, partial [Defluviitaleaceae bacterium]|nr:radical SAM protein [Defluviitaleaceae bacterium]